jgi:hypothetical protein
MMSVGTLSKSLLLFTLNWLDAQLTLVWIRLHVATEGNGLMAHVLSYGEAPFLIIKLLVGAFAAYVLYRCAHLTLARRGMTVVLSIYLGLMGIHAAAGCSALGWNGPVTVIAFFGHLPRAIFGLIS